MATFISTDKYERWWRKAQLWFATQFASINIDTSDLAKEATLGDVQDALDYMEQGGMPEIGAIAKQGSNASANISDIQALIGYTISEIDGV